MRCAVVTGVQTCAIPIFMLAITSPRLAGLAAIGIPAVIIPIALFGKRVREQSRASQDRLADASARASETLNAMHTVQSYARESHESERFADAANRTYHTSRIRIQTQSLMTALVIVLIFGAITGVLWVGAKDVIAGNMSRSEEHTSELQSLMR